MNNLHSFVKRVLLAGGLTLGILATAALGGSTAGAEAPPGSLGVYAVPISAVEAKAAGTYALVSFITVEPAAVTVEYKPVTTMAAPAAGGQSPAQGYATKHERKLMGLTSNTTYDVTVTATTQSGQKHTTKTSFTTAKKRVRIILESIDIQDDGDSIFTGDGEPLWTLGLSWAGLSNTVAYCLYPQPCKHGSFGEGRITPRNSEGKALMIVFAEENFDRFPDLVSLWVEVDEEDTWHGEGIKYWDCLTKVFDGGCLIGGYKQPTVWRVPQGVESASERLTIRGDDIDTGFESVLTFHFEVVHVHAPDPAVRNNPRTTFK